MNNSHAIKPSIVNTALCAAFVMSAAVCFSIPASATPSQAPVAAAQAVLPSGGFIKKKKALKGSWSVVQENGQTIIRFSDDFKTKNGPDLKVFLSPKNVETVTGKTAVDGAVLLGVLQSNKGGQDYVVPEGVNLSDFESVLVHCEAYSILWGGGDL